MTILFDRMRLTKNKNQTPSYSAHDSRNQINKYNEGGYHDLDNCGVYTLKISRKFFP